MFPASCSRRLTSNEALSACTIVWRSSRSCSSGLMHVKRRAHPSREFEHGAGDAEFCLLERGGGDPLAERHVEGIQKAHHHAELKIRAHPRQRKEHRRVEERILEQARLHQIGLADAELGIDGLKIAIVQQRDLDRVIGGQSPFEQRSQLFRGLLVQLGAAFHCSVIAARSSMARLTSGNPARGFTDAQPERPSRTHSPNPTFRNVMSSLLDFLDGDDRPAVDVDGEPDAVARLQPLE